MKRHKPLHLILFSPLFLVGCNPPPGAANGSSDDAASVKQASGQVKNLVQIQRSRPNPALQENDELIALVLQGANELWTRQFARFGDQFTPVTAVVFDGVARSPCRDIQQSDGATFCHANNKVYFSDASWSRFDQAFGGYSPIAHAVVIAHEVGHGVHRQTGVFRRTMDKEDSLPQSQKGFLSSKLELQADCYAGMWFRERPESRDPEARKAASYSRFVSSDDFEQMRVRGYVDPAFASHGTTAQRVEAFERGLNSGNPDVCEFDL